MTEAAPEMSCCNREMEEVARAERPGHNDRVQRVCVYRCEICGRVNARGESCDGGWVNAKAQMFLTLRREAFERAGLGLPPPATAIFDIAPRLVIFVPRAPLNGGTSR